MVSAQRNSSIADRTRQLRQVYDDHFSKISPCSETYLTHGRQISLANEHNAKRALARTRRGNRKRIHREGRHAYRFHMRTWCHYICRHQAKLWTRTPTSTATPTRGTPLVDSEEANEVVNGSSLTTITRLSPSPGGRTSRPCFSPLLHSWLFSDKCLIIYAHTYKHTHSPLTHLFPLMHVLTSILTNNGVIRVSGMWLYSAIV